MVMVLPVEVDNRMSVTHRDAHISRLVDDHRAVIAGRKQLNVLMISPSAIGMQDMQCIIRECSTEETLWCEVTDELWIETKHVRF